MQLQVDHIEVLAHFLAKEGEWYFDNLQFSKSKQKLLKALKLFDFVDQQKQTFSFERKATLEKVNSIISQIESNYKNDNT